MEKNFCIDLFNFPIEGGKEISLPAQVSPQQMNFCLDLCNVPTEGGQEFSLPGQVSQQQMCFCLDLCNVPMEGGKEFSLPASLIVESQLEDGYWQPLIRERVDQDIKAGRKIKERRFACGHNGCSAKFSKKFNLRVHERIHTGEKPHVCRAQGCGERFRWRSGLRSHSKKLHGCLRLESRSIQKLEPLEDRQKIPSSRPLPDETETEEAELRCRQEFNFLSTNEDSFLEILEQFDHHLPSSCFATPSPSCFLSPSPVACLLATVPQEKTAQLENNDDLFALPLCFETQNPSWISTYVPGDFPTQLDPIIDLLFEQRYHEVSIL